MAQDMTTQRIAENQSRFREANEQIGAAADRMQIEVVPFLCECPRERCTEIVRMTLVEYEGIRQSATCFLCTPGHEDVSVGAGAAVVTGGVEGRYVAVQKIGEAGAIAAERYDELMG